MPWADAGAVKGHEASPDRCSDSLFRSATELLPPACTDTCRFEIYRRLRGVPNELEHLPLQDSQLSEENEYSDQSPNESSSD